jgi:hypothetical protein
MLAHALSSVRHVTATLEADLDRDGSIDGSLLQHEGDPIPFSGWLDLAGAITILADRPSTAGATAARMGADGDSDAT